MKVSFTGTQLGMSDRQIKALEEWFDLHKNAIAIFAHGLCKGADIQAHRIARRIVGRSLFIAGFPSTAATRVPDPVDIDYIAAPKPPLRRNPDIVDAGNHLLIAAPKQDEMIVRSGTWTTVRIAEKKHVKVHILAR